MKQEYPTMTVVMDESEYQDHLKEIQIHKDLMPYMEARLKKQDEDLARYASAVRRELESLTKEP